MSWRRLLSIGVSQRKIAKQFGVHQTGSGDIKNNKIWRHVPVEPN